MKLLNKMGVGPVREFESENSQRMFTENLCEVHPQQ